MSDRADHVMIFCWVAIVALGAVMVASATVALGQGLLFRHLAFLGVGFVALAGVLCVPLEWWRRGHRLAWLAAVALCAVVLVPGIGQEVNGARRWIDLGAFSLQAAEATKFLLPIYLAGYLERFHGELRDDPRALLRPLLMLAVVGVLLLMQPDFGSLVVLAAATCGLLFVAGARLRHFLTIIVVGVAILGVLAAVQPYRLQRLITFVDPWQFAYGSGYQLTQALIAFGRGETFGLGLGEGIQKLFYLPEAHNDFIFAVIAEELGLVGALAVVALFAVLILRMLRLGRHVLEAHDAAAAAGGRSRGAALEPGVFGGYLAYGVGLMLGVQCLVNLGVNAGILPTKGLTLPFVSYGGNSLLASCAMIGLVLRVQFEGVRHG